MTANDVTVTETGVDVVVITETETEVAEVIETGIGIEAGIEVVEGILVLVLVIATGVTNATRVMVVIEGVQKSVRSVSFRACGTRHPISLMQIRFVCYRFINCKPMVQDMECVTLVT
jgi:hypothetical protein